MRGEIKTSVRDFSKLTFFSSLTSSLMAHKYISPNQGEDFKRSFLRETNLGYDDCKDLLHEVAPLIPDHQLFSMMHRFRMVGVIDELLTLLTAQVQQLMDRTKLFFNRPLYLEREGQPSTQTLMSVLLLDVAEHEESIFRDAVRLQSKIKDYPFSSSPEFAQTLAAYLNMEEASHCLPLFYGENQINQELAHLFEGLARLIESLWRNISAQFKKSNISYGQILPGEILSECHRLRHISLEPSEVFSQWFLSSDLTVQLSYDILAKLSQYGEELFDMLCLSGYRSNPITGSFITHNLLKALSSTGLGSPKSQEVLSALERYCRLNQVDLEDITSIELPKISPHLNAGLLKLIQAIDKDKSTNQLLTSEKDDIWQRCKKITKSLGISF